MKKEDGVKTSSRVPAGVVLVGIMLILIIGLCVGMMVQVLITGVSPYSHHPIIVPYAP